MDFLKRHISLLAACAVTALLFSGWSYLFSPPFNFPSGSIIAVPRGAPAPEIAQELADMHIVAHPTVLKLIFRITGTGSQVQAGAYLFPSPQNVLVVAYRLITGSYDLPPVRITFPRRDDGARYGGAGEQRIPSHRAEGVPCRGPAV